MFRQQYLPSNTKWVLNDADICIAKTFCAIMRKWSVLRNITNASLNNGPMSGTQFSAVLFLKIDYSYHFFFSPSIMYSFV